MIFKQDLSLQSVSRNDERRCPFPSPLHFPFLSARRRVELINFIIFIGIRVTSSAPDFIEMTAGKLRHFSDNRNKIKPISQYHELGELLLGALRRRIKNWN